MSFTRNIWIICFLCMAATALWALGPLEPLVFHELDDSNTQTSGIFTYIIAPDDTACIVDIESSGSTITIPATLGVKPVARL